MKLTPLLVLNHGIVCYGRNMNQAHLAEARLLPFLVPVRPVECAPVKSLLLELNEDQAGRRQVPGEASGIGSRRGRGPSVWRQGHEDEGSTPQPTPTSRGDARQRRARIARWLAATALAAIALLTLSVMICCGIGAEHIAHVRQVNRLGQRLRARESELHRVNQAYRSLTAEVAMRAGQEAQAFAAHPASGKILAMYTGPRS